MLSKNLLPSIGDSVNATKDETTIANDKAIAVSLNNVPAIPSMNMSGKNTATNINVVAIIAKVICFDPLNAATSGVSPCSILRATFRSPQYRQRATQARRRWLPWRRSKKWNK